MERSMSPNTEQTKQLYRDDAKSATESQQGLQLQAIAAARTPTRSIRNFFVFRALRDFAVKSPSSSSRSSLGVIARKFAVNLVAVYAVIGTAIGPLSIGAELAAGPVERPRVYLIEGVPHVRQKPDFCGEACAEMVLRKLGKKLDQDFVFNQSKLDPHEGRGCYTVDLARALTAIGFRVGPVWQKIPVAAADASLDKAFNAILADLKAGFPSIVCTHFDDRPGTTEHFRLVLGYDPKTEEVIYHDPAVADGAYLRMKKSQFLKLWPLKYSNDTWTLVCMRMDPDDAKLSLTAASGKPSKFSPADYAQHVLKLKAKLPEADGFAITLQPPFVVIGDESAETVKSRSEKTVHWAVDKLKQSYFDRDPAEILDIWLFKDKASYEKHAVQFFEDKPTTPYGYFTSVHRALVMNISTGSGTLVHEIVHPFMAANFTTCPSWFNEGLASLYEHCGEEDGRIHGYTNWRLPALQNAIKKGTVPSFATLCATTTEEFYHKDPGTNYSQARYLCYYLQEHGLLEKYYRAFKAHAADDPGGYKTLQKILDEPDLKAFQKRWEAWVAKLEVD